MSSTPVHVSGKSSPAKDLAAKSHRRELPGPEPGVTQNVFFLFKKGSILDKCLFSEVWENLPEGCPEQRKTLSLRPSYLIYLHDGYHWTPLGFLSFGMFLSSHPGYFTAWGSLLSTSCTRKNFPFQKVSDQVSSFYKGTSSFYFNSGSPCPNRAMCPIGRHIHPTKAVNKHTHS